ncbi:unnamed protein product [Nippostrongylus brasiliensis]|uniref:Alpha-galactosidase n=1 Tax=Nippostrongylus brasiliensis TaxID=27835 RepID=A0A0N4XLH2_NIPBR|nr:unnamed protein product [Nippostrongylus brasiliensis]
MVVKVVLEPEAQIAVGGQELKIITGRVMKNQKVEKISDCFVFWRNGDGRTLGVNTLSAKDATLFLNHTAPSTTPLTTMVQHNVIAQVGLLFDHPSDGFDLKVWNCDPTPFSTAHVVPTRGRCGAFFCAETAVFNHLFRSLKFVKKYKYIYTSILVFTNVCFINWLTPV